MLKLEEMTNNWATEIGRVFIAFGNIEYITHQCMCTVPRDTICAVTSKMMLGPRIDLLQAILAPLHQGHAMRLALLLQRAKELSERRNIIAHNPLGLDLYVTEKGEKTFCESIRSLRNSEKVLAFSQLIELRFQTEALVIELTDAKDGLIEELREVRRREVE
jgi:hypothetical protein